MLSFQNIEFLYGLAALIPLVGLFFYVLRWKKKVRKSLGSERLINQLTDDYSHKKYVFKVVAIIVAIGLLLISAANLRKPIKEKGTVGNGIDVMIALDVSKSMLAEDEKPTRLDKAKQLIYQLTEKLQNNRIGLVVFAGHAYLQMPLTSDIGAAKMFVSNVNPNLISWQGTVIGEALTLCSNSLDTKEKKYKAAILITDGEDQDTKAIDAAKDLAEKGVIVHTVGVGSVEGAPIIEPGTNEYKRNANGETVITKLNIKILQQIADATGGTYHYLDNTEAVGNDLSQVLNAMDKKEFGTAGGYVNYESYYFIFLAIAVLLLIIELFVSERKGKVIINRTGAMLIVLILLSVPVLSQSNSTILKGNELYRKGDFKGAQGEYEKVLEKDSKNNTAAFNNANSLYRQQQYAEAARQMEALAGNTTDPILQAKAWYNKGIAEVKQKQMEQAAASFKKSLVLNNNDEETRENLQMVLNQLNTEKKKQDKPSDNNKQQPKDNKQPSKKQAEQQLNMLREEEKRLQKEIQQKKYKQESGEEKDW